MKKSTLLLPCFLLLTTVVKAQMTGADLVKKSLDTKNKDTVAWTHNGVFNLGGNEGFLHNWSAGGELASIAISSIFQGNLTRFNHRTIWTNDLDLAYGLFYAYSNSFVPRKTDDRIDFTSKYGYRIDTTKDFYLTGLFNFRSQFTKGYDYTMPVWDTTSTSNFFAPAYFTLAPGMEYRKGSDLSLFFSPIAARETFASKYYTIRSAQGAFGIPYGKTSVFQFGAYFSGRYNLNITKNMLFTTRLDLYSNYLAKDTKDSAGTVIKKDNPGNIQVLWDNLFSWKIAKYVSITFAATLIYDNNIPYDKNTVDASGNVVAKNLPGDNLGWWQIKQIFTIGFIYKF